MNFLYGSLFALGMLAITQVGSGQEKKETTKLDTLRLSVAQAQQYALENNQSILNANLDVEAAKKKIWETTAIGLPQANAKGAFQYTPEVSPTIKQFSGLGNLGYWMYNVNDYIYNTTGDQKWNPGPAQDPPTQTNPNDLKWSLNGTITVSQLIFSGSYLVGLQSAKVYKSLSELNQVKSKQDVFESIVNSYFNILIAHENKMILDSTYANLIKTYSDMQTMNKQGFIEETDLDQMQITISTVKNSLDQITRMESISKKMLNLQLGIDLNMPVVLTDNLKTMIDAFTMDQLLLTDLTLDNNVNYKMLDTQVKASELLLKLSKSAFLPDLAAFYQYYKEFNKNAFSFNPPHVIGAQLNIPLFSSGQRLAKVSQAKIDLYKARNTKDQMSNSLLLDFDNSRLALLTARDKYQSESNNLLLAKKIYNRSLIKYANGMLSNIELTQVQNQFLNAQSNYYLALQNLITAKSKLEKMLSKN
jgi:outer membrane protein